MKDTCCEKYENLLVIRDYGKGYGMIHESCTMNQRTLEQRALFPGLYNPAVHDIMKALPSSG